MDPPLVPKVTIGTAFEKRLKLLVQASQSYCLEMIIVCIVLLANLGP